MDRGLRKHPPGIGDREPVPAWAEKAHTVGGWAQAASGVAQGAMMSPVGAGMADWVLGQGDLIGATMPLGVLGVASGVGKLASVVQGERHSDPGKAAHADVKALEGLTSMAGGGANMMMMMGSAAAPMMAAAGVMGAASAGLGAGNALATHLDGNTLGGFFGRDDFGRERDAFDTSADWGMGAESWFQDLVGAREGSGSVGDLAGGAIGGITSAVASMGTGLAGGAVSLGRTIAGWFD